MSCVVPDSSFIFLFSLRRLCAARDVIDLCWPYDYSAKFETRQLLVDVVDDALFASFEVRGAESFIRLRDKGNPEYLFADEYFEECALVEIFAGFTFTSVPHLCLCFLSLHRQSQ